ncbi:hypothetical protein MiSe_20060 [Microseira wollei NIES-4236]|uniref:Transposase n=1 Tax=Microseira wollei NIES-4236 TaxID=2530354 RepID=A0AAV3X4Q1_9CYAN|nr:hypothetical protein MiSe_20060 [Microseira wollei NIES-4236]
MSNFIKFDSQLEGVKTELAFLGMALLTNTGRTHAGAETRFFRRWEFFVKTGLICVSPKIQ